MRMMNQKGQIIVEYILLMVVALAVATVMRGFLNETKFIQKFTFEPWARLDGMVQCGVWQPCGLEKRTQNLHPNSGKRIVTKEPEGK